MLLFTYFILFVSVAPLTGRVADGLANVVSTEIIPLFPATTALQEIEVNQTDKQECQMVLMKLALESLGDACNMLL